jgi:hypothetical protein
MEYILRRSITTTIYFAILMTGLFTGRDAGEWSGRAHWGQTRQPTGEIYNMDTETV